MVSKKTIIFVLSVVMIFGLLSACNRKEEKTEGTVQKTEETKVDETKTNTAQDVQETKTGTGFSGEDPKLKKKIKILTIWPEDNDNGVLINKICEDYKAKVNPNFEWEYEIVSPDNLRQKIATLAASNDLPDVFSYEAGTPLRTLIDSDKIVNISEALNQIGVADFIAPSARELLKNLSGTDELYDLPLGLNVEGFWYNKALFQDADCEVPTTWDEFEAVLAKLHSKGIQPLTTGGSNKWAATRLINAYAVRTMGNDVMTKAASGEIAYTDKGLVEAADKLREWAQKGYFGEGITTVDINTAGSMLMTGKAAIFYNGSWFTQSLVDETQNPAGPDGIGFFNIPIQDEMKSSALSYSMNCGNILALDKGKYDEGTAWFLKYFCENVGDIAMKELGSVKGYIYSVETQEINKYTKLVLDEIDKAEEGFAWWEAKMANELSKVAQDNVQPLLNGEITGAEYMQAIQDVYDLNK